MAERECNERLVSYDPNVRPSIEPDLEVWRRRLDQLSQFTHLIKISADDLDLLYPGREDAEAAQTWLARGARLVVVTHGAEGARAWTRHGQAEVAGKPVTLVDAVGAGDSFQAALLAGLAEADHLSPVGLDRLGKDQLARLLEFANQASAVTCSRRGANLPYRQELKPEGL